MGVGGELEAEQRFVDVAYARLDAMRADATAMLDEVLDLGRGGTFQSRTERDVIVRTSMARLEQLDIGDQALTFGRIDRVPSAADQGPSGASPGASPTGAGSEVFHIGRLAVHSASLDPLVVDWRAPVAAPFYRATGRDPQGLVLRRHLALDGRRVVGGEDERFGDGAGVDHRGGTGDSGLQAPGGAGTDGLLEGDIPIGGPAALLAALDRARSGRMVDIVSTIQREQDEIIRSPLPGVLVVQGGPGTGKTAVALHRAAYLLYTHRFPLERQGVLVVGPNPLFLRYIEQVLPSLGETGVTLSTVAGLVPGVRVRATEPGPVARVKGDARMATVIANAVRTRQRPLAVAAAIPYGTSVLRLTVDDTRSVVQAARRRPGTHNARRRLVDQALVQLLAGQVRRARQAFDGWAPGGPDDDSDPEAEETPVEELARQFHRIPEFRDVLDRIWPRLSAQELLHDLFGAPALVAAAGRGVLAPEEQALLVRPRSSSFDEIPWTVSDVALVDEARHLLGPRSGGTPAGGPPGRGDAEGAGDEIRNYGHIVVDEVQDLSPMQLRMVTRRSLSGSMTVVGDIGQATAPWTPRDWSEITRHLPDRREVRTVELTVSYRTPAEVIEVAGRVLALAAPELRPPTPVRRTGHPPRMIRVPDATGAGVAVLAERVARETAVEIAAVPDGRVAVVAPGGLLAPLADALAAAGMPVTPSDAQRRGGLSDPLVLLAADAVNGLEFDSVVVVEPGLIAGETARGLRTLYVALTRPTRRLTVVSATAAPAALADPS